MMESTKGPWNYFVGNANGRGLIRIEVDGTGEHIASMPRGKKSEDRARLIAAAPELLESLKDMADYYSADLNSVFGNEAGRLRKAIDAIAKATA